MRSLPETVKADLTKPRSKMKLWMALVEHREVPGTRLQFFYQEHEPTDTEVFARFEDSIPQSEWAELEVTDMFDVTWELNVQPENLLALLAQAAASTSK